MTKTITIHEICDDIYHDVPSWEFNDDVQACYQLIDEWNALPEGEEDIELFFQYEGGYLFRFFHENGEHYFCEKRFPRKLEVA